ncbi:MAG TPA: FecR domain-containing protein [Stellaceae bacterium]|nr:FecR domain-containing protein [Stellaceae bacterium]
MISPIWGAARRCSLVALLLASAVLPSLAAGEIGKTIVVVRTVTGTLATEVRQLVINDGVAQNELIATAADAASEIEFVDGTKLTLGPRARVVLDKFVYDSDPSKGAFFLSVSEGVFRFVTGTMAHQSYSIKTPNGTIGVRGTVFNMLVFSDSSIVQVVDGQVFGTAADGTPRTFVRGEYFTMRQSTGPSGHDDKTAIDAQVALMDYYVNGQQFAGFGLGSTPQTPIFPRSNTSVSPTRP